MTQPSPREIIEQWFQGLRSYRQTAGLPARGSVAAGLVVLERLKTDYTLDMDSHRAVGGAQIQGLNPSAIKRILERYGETRLFLKEGGRTNRGNPQAVELLLDALRPLRLERRDNEERVAFLEELQQWLAGKVQEYFNRRRVEIEFDSQLTTSANIRNILLTAAETAKDSAVAQYLVGAKLQLRFPHLEIRNELASAADDPSGSHGDFEVGDTVFHVTVSPGVNVVEKCQSNLIIGKRPVLVVPERAVLAAQNFAHHFCEDRIFVVSIETFIASNLEELSVFQHAESISGFRRLLEVYNSRVDAIDPDKTRLIEIPPNL